MIFESTQPYLRARTVVIPLCNCAPLLFVSVCHFAEFSGGTVAKSNHCGEGKQIQKASQVNELYVTIRTGFC